MKRDKLKPGELIFLDQFESRLPGRIFNNQGTLVHKHKYKGGSLYCNAATGRVKIYFQSFFTAKETLQKKLRFEKSQPQRELKSRLIAQIMGIYFKEVHR